jgi:hypothetical protein
MDIEWAKDGLNNQLILFRPTRNDLWKRKNKFEIYKLKERTIKGPKVTKSPRKARILHNPQEEINCWKAKFSSQT